MMKGKILLVLSAALVSVALSAFLGRLALSITPFGRMMTEMRSDSSSAGRRRIENRYVDLLDATNRMLRLTTFVLDPVAAVITGFLIGLTGTKSPAVIAGFAILPLAVFSASSYPWMWGGLSGGLLDVFGAAVAASLTSAYVTRAHPRS